MANSSLVPNTNLLGHTNIQKAKFEKFGSEEAKVALCVCLFTLQSNSCEEKKKLSVARKFQPYWTK